MDREEIGPEGINAVDRVGRRRSSSCTHPEARPYPVVFPKFPPPGELASTVLSPSRWHGFVFFCLRQDKMSYSVRLHMWLTGWVKCLAPRICLGLSSLSFTHGRSQQRRLMSAKVRTRHRTGNRNRLLQFELGYSLL